MVLVVKEHRGQGGLRKILASKKREGGGGGAVREREEERLNRGYTVGRYRYN